MILLDDGPRNRKATSGVTLIECLLTFAVLSSGLLAVLSFLISVQVNVADVRALTGAAGLAQQKIHQFESIVNRQDVRLSNGTDAIAFTNVDFLRSWTLQSAVADPNLKTIKVTVSWVDRTNQDHFVVLGSELTLDDSARGFGTLLRKIVQTYAAESPNPWGI